MDKLKSVIRDYIEAHEQEMLEDTIMLCSIDSAQSETKPGMPYGEGPYKALMAAEELCRKYGFKTKVYADRVVTADMTDKEACLDILAHMDVVPGGDGWTVTEAFKPVIKDGAIYGRGTSDDKGPAVAALYAMRAIKELGIELNKNCRLILGSDEETGSSDIEHYYSVEKEAPMTFSPDAEFPIINVEKGQFRGTVSWKNTSEDTSINESGKPRLVFCSSGHTINIVPNKAMALLTGADEKKIAEIAELTKQKLGADFTFETVGYELSDAADVPFDKDMDLSEAVWLRVFGESAHASTPEKGVNALVIMLQILAELDFADNNFDKAVKELAKLFPYGDHEGAGVGAAAEDEIAGKTSMTADILEATEKGFKLIFDSRTCLKHEHDKIQDKVEETVSKAGFEFSCKFVPAHAVDGNSVFIKTLLDCYENVTGKEGKCLAIGGGTYVHELKNGVAFGAVGETTDTHMHGPDEFMLIDEFKDAVLIYALAIAKLCA